MAKQRIPKVKAGDKAPDFNVADQQGEIRSLRDFKGKKLVLFFYPKDNTPGCTKEACNLRDNYSRLKKAGYEVIGVSTDSAASHQKFIDKQELPFSLLADTDMDVVKAYDVYGDKVLYGKKYKGVFRTTFLINEKGVVEEVISDVDTADHAAQILK